MTEIDATKTKEKKEKKGKKDKKDKKEKKEKVKALGEPVDVADLNKKSSDEYLNNDRFKPVPNPSFNPSLISPLSSPVASSTKSIAVNNNENSTEKWVLSSKRNDSIRVNNEKTPAELQGFTAQKYIPSAGYSHLDPSKHENAHAAFNHLQKVVMAGFPGDQSVPQQGTSTIPQQQPQAKSLPLQPQPQQVIPPLQQQPQQLKTPQQHQMISSQQRPPPMNDSNKRARPDRLPDGVPIIQYCRAIWSYTAQIPSELSFNANESLAIISKQPDDWWHAELLAEPHRRKRGLVPGNYMTPN